MVILTAQGWLSAALGHGMGSSYVGEGIRIWMEKEYDRVDREALWSVLKIYGVGGQLLMGIQAFYRGKCICEGVREVQ